MSSATINKNFWELKSQNIFKKLFSSMCLVEKSVFLANLPYFPLSSIIPFVRLRNVLKNLLLNTSSELVMNIEQTELKVLTSSKLGWKSRHFWQFLFQVCDKFKTEMENYFYDQRQSLNRFSFVKFCGTPCSLKFIEFRLEFLLNSWFVRSSTEYLPNSWYNSRTPSLSSQSSRICC